ncbi:hypothetical protein M436DRAFT_67749 [Aureobasidium namibiae CBS 147.97]|uniref:Uncharacterized protein n=1 Tax=Aureobasidium namibiae CBS 147.97 TaxID=1043004 RepID=A0A074W6T0_9PEZI
MNNLRPWIPTYIRGIQVVPMHAAGNKDNERRPTTGASIGDSLQYQLQQSPQIHHAQQQYEPVVPNGQYREDEPYPTDIYPFVESAELLNDFTTDRACSSSSPMRASPTFLTVLLLRLQLHVRPSRLSSNVVTSLFRRCHLFLMMSLPRVPSYSPVMLPPFSSRSLQGRKVVNRQNCVIKVSRRTRQNSLRLKNTTFSSASKCEQVCEDGNELVFTPGQSFATFQGNSSAASSTFRTPSKASVLKLLNIGPTPDGASNKASSLSPVKILGSGLSSPSRQPVLRDGPPFSTEVVPNVTETCFVRFGMIPAECILIAEGVEEIFESALFVDTFGFIYLPGDFRLDGKHETGSISR